jgi:LacI family transcriptional regulator
MTTMREVAAAAGVSAKTVSRVFNDDPHVTPETRARVEVALRQLNYVPNAVATTFRTGRSPVVGIAVPDIVDPFFAAIAKSVGGSRPSTACPPWSPASARTCRRRPTSSVGCSASR